MAQLSLIERRERRARVVQEADLGYLALIAECAQHCHDRRDPAPATDQEHAFRPPVGEDEFALSLGQVDDQPRPDVLAQVTREPAHRVGGDGHLQGAVGRVLGTRERVGPAHANPRDVRTESHELPRPESLPVRVRSKREGDALRGLEANSHDLGANVASEHQRADQLRIPVHAVRICECLQQSRPEQAPADSAGALGFGKSPDHHDAK